MKAFFSTLGFVAYIFSIIFFNFTDKKDVGVYLLIMAIFFMLVGIAHFLEEKGK
jgi:hypothetical protein